MLMMGLQGSAVASTSRVMLTAARAATTPTRGMATKTLIASKSIPEPTGTVKDPSSFLTAISGTRRDLASNSSLVSLLGEEFTNIFSTSSASLKQAGVTTKDRRYFLWAVEKFRQGQDPKSFVIDAKPKKKVRGWGPRVQTAERIRVRGVRKPGEK